MNKDKEIAVLLIAWYNSIDQQATRITSGNLSHNLSALKGTASRCVEFLDKHYPDNELANKHSEIFSNFVEKFKGVTSGNYAHSLASVRMVAMNWSNILKQKYRI